MQTAQSITSTPQAWADHPGKLGSINYNGWIITFWADDDEDDGFCWSVLGLESQDTAFMDLRELTKVMERDGDIIDRQVYEAFKKEIEHGNHA